MSFVAWQHAVPQALCCSRPVMCWGSNRRLPTTSWSAKTYSPALTSPRKSTACKTATCVSAARRLHPAGMSVCTSHQRDPTIVYLLSGMLTNHHNDGTTEMFREGQVFAEFGPRAHWVENQGTAPVILLVANIDRRQ